jgi:hypothetical protein
MQEEKHEQKEHGGVHTVPVRVLDSQFSRWCFRTTEKKSPKHKKAKTEPDTSQMPDMAPWVGEWYHSTDESILLIPLHDDEATHWMLGNSIPYLYAVLISGCALYVSIYKCVHVLKFNAYSGCSFQCQIGTNETLPATYPQHIRLLAHCTFSWQRPRLSTGTHPLIYNLCSPCYCICACSKSAMCNTWGPCVQRILHWLSTKITDLEKGRFFLPECASLKTPKQEDDVSCGVIVMEIGRQIFIKRTSHVQFGAQDPDNRLATDRTAKYVLPLRLL